MKKNSTYLPVFLVILLFFVGCSSDSNNDATEEVKMELNIEQKYEYSYINGIYSLDKMFDKTIGSITRADGEVEDSNSIDSTDLPNEDLGEYNNFEIISIDDKEVVLLNNIYSSEDAYNTKTIWKFNCEITNGSLAAFNRGETIEVKSINDSEYDTASEALLKGIVIKNFESADPYQTSVKINTSNHVFLINKRHIYESSNSSASASIKVLK
jgi:hypothetical protein